MLKFQTLEVQDVTKETKDCVSVAFKIPTDLKPSFKFIQGQYITLRKDIDGKEVRRSYSISSSPVTESEFRIAVKKVKDGRMSGWINDHLKAGDKIEVMPPTGNFHIPLDSSAKRKYVFYAGGSGITPIISIIKTTLHVETFSSIILFYANQDESSVIFKTQVDLLEKEYADRLKVIHILNECESSSDPLLKGVMTQDKVAALVSKFIPDTLNFHHFICGPGPMMMNVVEALKGARVPQDKVHLEYFAAPEDTSAIAEQPSPPTVGNESFRSKVTIINDGEETFLDLGADDVILDKALDANIDAPYACRGGSCCTCRAKLIEGKVEMKVNYALLDSEVEEGYILTCQSRPLTPIVVVDYDKGR